MVKLISFLLIYFSLGGNSFEKELKSYLEGKLTAYNSFQFEVVKMPGSADRIKIAADKEFKISGSIGYVPIYIYNNSKKPSNSYLTVKLKLMKNVLVAKESIKTKSNLKPQMFQRKLMDVAKLRGTIFTDTNQLVNYKTSNRLMAGKILVHENVSKIPDIVSGNPLNAFSDAGSVSVSTKAFAREDGNIGENIKIRTIDNKMFIAKIVDIKKVIILE